MRLILASGSPRRKELLRRLVPDFEVVSPQVDESFDHPAPVHELVVELAERKAAAVARDNPDAVVLAGDTLVSCNGAILGQPVSEADARDTLGLLNGVEQQVCTGLAVAVAGAVAASAFCVSDVRLDLPKDALAAYIDNGTWRGKAGAYGLQDPGIRDHASVQGPWSNVVGLPLQLAWRLLRDAGTPVGDEPGAQD